MVHLKGSLQLTFFLIEKNLAISTTFSHFLKPYVFESNCALTPIETLKICCKLQHLHSVLQFMYKSAVAAASVCARLLFSAAKGRHVDVFVC